MKDHYNPQITKVLDDQRTLDKAIEEEINNQLMREFKIHQGQQKDRKRAQAKKKRQLKKHNRAMRNRR